MSKYDGWVTRPDRNKTVLKSIVPCNLCGHSISLTRKCKGNQEDGYVHLPECPTSDDSVAPRRSDP